MTPNPITPQPSPLTDRPRAGVRHPAKYSDCLLPIFGELLTGARRVLDPFAGTGKLKLIRPDAILTELEYPWARLAAGVQADALALPFAPGTFDAVCTSPAYGNRMADHFTDGQPDKNYRRNTYRHALGQPLHPSNAGGLQWGPGYQDFHRRAWAECWRVLAPGGRLILNISDHIRAGRRQPVSAWHALTLAELGFRLLARRDVPTPRNRQGANGAARVDCEHVYLFVKTL